MTPLSNRCCNTPTVQMWKLRHGTSSSCSRAPHSTFAPSTKLARRTWATRKLTSTCRLSLLICSEKPTEPFSGEVNWPPLAKCCTANKGQPLQDDTCHVTVPTSTAQDSPGSQRFRIKIPFGATKPFVHPCMVTQPPQWPETEPTSPQNTLLLSDSLERVPRTLGRQGRVQPTA